MISFADFKQMDLRVGKVLEVKDHPNADKLYVLKIDIGGEVRQSCAGLKSSIPPAELEGKTVVVLANLEPAMLRGVESQCMLLAAEHEGDVTLVSLAKDVPPGAKVL